MTTPVIEETVAPPDHNEYYRGYGFGSHWLSQGTYTQEEINAWTRKHDSAKSPFARGVRDALLGKERSP